MYRKPWHRLSNAEQLVTLGLIAVFLTVACSRGIAKDTGLIFVSNEKTNNVIIIDPKTNKVVKDLRTSRRPRPCISAPTIPSSTSPAVTTT